MAILDGWPAASGTVDSTELRKDLAGLVYRNTSNVARQGVLPHTPSSLVAARASMGVDVTDFNAISVRGGGPIFMRNEGTVTVPVGAAPGANSRYDIVYFKQNESASPYTDGSNTPVWGYVSGSASASPSLSAAVASVPAGGVPFASVLIPSTATTTLSSGVVVTPIHDYTTATGGPLWVRNDTERGALTLVPEGTLVWQVDTNTMYVHNGTTTTVVSEDTGWVAANTVATAGFSGTLWDITTLQVRRKDGVVYISGYASKTAWNAGETILTFNAGWRPAFGQEITIRSGNTYTPSGISTAGVWTPSVSGATAFGLSTAAVIL